MGVPFRWTAAGAFAIAAIAAAGRAEAQTTLPSIDARTWRPSVDPGAQLVLESPNTPGPWAWNVGAYESYALRPITLRDAGTDDVAFRPVEHLFVTDLVASVGLGDRAQVGVALPMALYQDGSANMPSTVASTSRVPAFAIGDLAIHGKATIVGNDAKLAGFGLAVLGAASLPTGDRASFLGEGSTTVSARALVEYKYVVARVQASLGYRLRTDHHAWPDPSVGGVTFGDEIPWSLAVALRPGFLLKGMDEDNRQTIELGFHGWLPAGPVGPFGSGDPGSARLSPVLLAVSDRIEIGHYKDVYALGGVDVGLDDAIGVPSVRVVAAIGWAPREHDEDHDGVPDDVDQCTPDMPEDRDGIQDDDGCPEDDADEDGVLDVDDACPLVAGVESHDKKKNGCPDAEGEKPQAAPPKSAPAPTPAPSSEAPDRDGDTYANQADACPDAAEVFNGVKDDDGCPDEGGAPLVTVQVGDRPVVALAKPLVFTGTDATPKLDDASVMELRALAQAANGHPEWTLAVGAKPAGDADAARQAALTRADLVSRTLDDLTFRATTAEVVTWDAVAALPGSAAGLGFLVLVSPTVPGPGGGQ